MLKKAVSLTTMLLASTVYLHADVSYKKQTPASAPMPIENSMASVKPNVCWDNDFFVTGDYLYWRPYMDGLAYAVTFDNVSKTGQVQNLGFSYTSGFRIGLGYRMPHDKWETDVNWTRFYANAANGVSTNTNSNFIYPEWSNSIGPDQVDYLYVGYENAKWNLHLNLLDGEFARFFMITPRVSLKPHFGVRGAWIFQKYEENLTGGVEGQINIVQNNVQMTNRFRGVGARFGLNSEWIMWNHWSLFGNAAGSLLYGKFKLKQGTAQSTTTSPYALLSSIIDKIHEVVPTADFAMGLKFDSTFWDDMMAFSLALGWEVNSFFGQGKFKHTFNTNSAQSFVADHEDLTMQGLLLSARLDF